MGRNIDHVLRGAQLRRYSTTNNVLQVLFAGALNSVGQLLTSSLPAIGSFTVEDGGVPQTVSAVTVHDYALHLTLPAGSTVSHVAYTKAETDQLKDGTGKVIASWTAFPVETVDYDLMPPTYDTGGGNGGTGDTGGDTG